MPPSCPKPVEQRCRAPPKVMDVSVRHQMRAVSLIDRAVEGDGCGFPAVERGISAAVPDRVYTDRLGIAEDRQPIGIGRELRVSPLVHELAIGRFGIRRPPSCDRGHDADLDVGKLRRRIEAADHRNEGHQAIFDHVGATEFGPAIEQNGAAERLVLVVAAGLNDDGKLLIGRHRNALQIGLLIGPGAERARIGDARERCEPPAAVRKLPADARARQRGIVGVGGPVPEAREIGGRRVGRELRGDGLRPALVLRQPSSGCTVNPAVESMRLSPIITQSCGCVSQFCSSMSVVSAASAPIEFVTVQSAKIVGFAAIKA